MDVDTRVLAQNGWHFVGILFNQRRFASHMKNASDSTHKSSYLWKQAIGFFWASQP